MPTEGLACPEVAAPRDMESRTEGTSGRAASEFRRAKPLYRTGGSIIARHGLGSVSTGNGRHGPWTAGRSTPGSQTLHEQVRPRGQQAIWTRVGTLVRALG